MSWDNSRQDYRQVYQQDGGYDDPPRHEGKVSHELIAGAAAFAGFHEYEKHQRDEGKTVSHGFAKELLAGFAAAEVDKLAETKGEDLWDTEKAKHEAKKRSGELYEEHYEQNQGASEYDSGKYPPHEHIREHHHKEHQEQW